MADLTQTLVGNTLSGRPPITSVEKGPRSCMVVDSEDKLYGNPFAFTVDLGYNLSKARYIQLKKVIVPKLNNVNGGNNTFVIKHALGTTGTITIPTGMYNTTTVANTLTSVINAAFVTAAIVDTVTTSFDTTKRAFTISSVLGLNLFIVDSGDFIKYGKTLIPFQSEPLANTPSTSVIYSGTAAMLPGRYIVVSSSALCMHQFGRSILSTPDKPSDVVGIIDVSDVYEAVDFDISIPFKGIYRPIKAEAYQIPVMNSGNEMVRHIDLRLTDGYGRDLSRLFNLTAPYPIETALSVVLIFEIVF